jgi:hypothetical protein
MSAFNKSNEEQGLLREHTALREFWEKVDLVLYLAVIVVVTPVVTSMLIDAWLADGVGRTSVIAVQRLLGVSLVEIKAFGLGGFVGLAVLLAFDELKRIHSVLLSVTAAIALGMWHAQGVFFPIHPAQNMAVLASGFVTAFVLGGGYRLRTGSPPYEFRGATSALFWLLTVLVSVGFVESHLAYENPLTVSSSGAIEVTPAAAQMTLIGSQLFADFVASSVFLLGAFLFTSYEARNRIVLAGVQRAGKTTLFGLLHIGAEDESDGTKLNPSDPLSRLVTTLRSANDGWGDEEYVGPTEKGEYFLLQFQKMSGELFKEYNEVDFLDYAGEYLDEEVTELVHDYAPQSRLSLSWLVYTYEELRGLPRFQEHAEGLDSGEIKRLLAKQIVHADTLVFTVDSGSLLPSIPYGQGDYEAQEDLGEYINTYVQILRHVDESVLSEKDVVLTATKADYLYPLYQESDIQLSFFNWVNYYLLEDPEGREKIESLLNQTQVNRVYPVYYHLDYEASVEAGEPVLERPIDGNGHKHLLERITEGE